MKLPRQKRDETSAAITQSLWLIVGFSTLFVVAAYASNPSWWSSTGTGTQSAVIYPPQVVTNSGIVTTNYVRNDYTVVTQGQLKHFTTRAVDYLNATLPEGAGSNLDTMVSNWAQDYLTNGYATNPANPTLPYKPSDLQAVNVGQLKYIANLVDTQLAVAGYTGLYPSWLAPNTNTDGAAANLGQLKEVFNFDFDFTGAPPAVTNLTAAGEPEEVDLSWTLPAMNYAQSLTIEESTDGGATWTSVATLAADATSYAAGGLSSTQTYVFEVTDSNGGGSSTSGATTPTQPQPPLPLSPTELTGHINSDFATNYYINLSWTASTGAASYQVQRETLSTGTWSNLATVTGTNTYQDLTYDKGGYHYRVSAINDAGGISVPSAEFPHSRYAVIDLGANNNPSKITDSGYVLMSNTTNVPSGNKNAAFACWYNGTNTALNPAPGLNGQFAVDIGEDGTVIGTGYDPNYDPYDYIEMFDEGDPDYLSIGAYALLKWGPGSGTASVQYAPQQAIWTLGYPYAARPDGFYEGYNYEAALAISSGDTLWTSRSVYLGCDSFENDTPLAPGVFEDQAIENQGTSDVLCAYVAVTAVNTNGDWLGYGETYAAYANESTPPYIDGMPLSASSAEEMLLSATHLNNLGMAVGHDGLTGHTFLSQDGETTNAYPAGAVDYGDGPLNAATMTVDGSPQPAPQMLVGFAYGSGFGFAYGSDFGLGSSSGWDLPYFGYGFGLGFGVVQMNPATGQFSPALGLSDLLPAHSGWSNVSGNNLNDNGAIVGTATYSGTNTAIAAGSHGVMLLPLQSRVVDRDDPTQTWANNVLQTGIPPQVYGGIIDGDMVGWKIGGTDSWSSATFTWTVTDSNGNPVIDQNGVTITGPTGAGINEWRIATWSAGGNDPANQWLTWNPGTYNIKCVISFAGGGTNSVTFQQVVGQRTKDVVVIAWINGPTVPLSATGVDLDVQTFFPISGSISTTAQKLLTAAYLGDLSSGDNTTPTGGTLTSADSTYILNWMFKYGGNSAPPNSFANEDALEAFEDFPTNFKLFNRLQIHYLINGPQFTSSSQFGSEQYNPRVTNDPRTEATDIGTTIDPVLGQQWPGQQGPENGWQKITGNKSFHQVNDGSPDGWAVAAFNTLMSPLLWNDIGSKIDEGIPLDQGTPPVTGYTVETQVYPTYYIYERASDNGFYLMKVIPQAATPSGNFNSSPYYVTTPTGSAPYTLPYP